MRDPIQDQVERQIQASRSEEAIRQAYQAVIDTEAGQIVFGDLLNGLFHHKRTQDQESRVLQQFALLLLERSGLVPEERGSFPLEYVQALRRLKLQRQNPGADVPDVVVQPDPVAAVRRKGFLGRLLQRIF